MERTENNWLETNVVGTLIHLVAYLFAFQMLLARLQTWQQIFLLIPLAFVVWVYWLLALYLNSLIIKFLRWCGLLRTTSGSQAQSFLVCLTVTGFAWLLITAGSWPGVIGILWMAALTLNLLAALLLAFTDGAHTSAR